MVKDLVALCFLEPAPSPLHKVYCLDGNKFDHCLWNLGWLTKEEAIFRRLDTDVKIVRDYMRRPDKMKPRKKSTYIAMFSEADWDMVFAALGRGLKVQAIYEEHYKDRTTFDSFRTQISQARKKRRSL